MIIHGNLALKQRQYGGPKLGDAAYDTPQTDTSRGAFFTAVGSQIDSSLPREAVRPAGKGLTMANFFERATALIKDPEDPEGKSAQQPAASALFGLTPTQLVIGGVVAFLLLRRR